MFAILVIPLRHRYLLPRGYQLVEGTMEGIGVTRMKAYTQSKVQISYLLDQLRACGELRIPEAERAKIFGGNARRLLRLNEA